MANAFTLVLVISGVATAGAIIVFFAPRFSVRALFGEEIRDGVAILVARHWGLLVFLVGALLIVAGYDPVIRVPVAVAAAIEKVVLVALLLTGAVKWTPLLKVVATVDGLFALLYIAFLSAR